MKELKLNVVLRRQKRLVVRKLKAAKDLIIGLERKLEKSVDDHKRDLVICTKLTEKNRNLRKKCSRKEAKVEQSHKTNGK